MEMNDILIFFILFVTVNALITSLFMWRLTGKFVRFFLSWLWIILSIQVIAMVGAFYLLFIVDNLSFLFRYVPFLFAFGAPLIPSVFVLNKMIKRMVLKHSVSKIKIWQSLGIAILAQALSLLASFWFFPRHRP